MTFFRIILTLIGLALSANLGAQGFYPDTVPMPADSVAELGYFKRVAARKHFRMLNAIRFSERGSYFSYESFIDSRLSDQLYQGIGVGTIVGQTLYEHSTMQWLYLNSGVGVNQASHGSFFLFTPRFELSYAKLKTLGQRSGFDLGVGGGLSGLYNVRLAPALGNNAYAHDLVGSVNLSAYAGRWITLFKRKSYFDLRANLPIISGVHRMPAYSFVGEMSAAVRPIGGFSRLNLDYGLTLPISRYSKENKVRVSYRWDFYGMNELDGLHKLRVAQHTLNMVYRYQF